ncbi:2-hydroxychromene-2-carboxylate isomerase [Ponticaulis sp.]|uniref:2-hydroxychromene-2-carboxylate isomerase n=1 Tax=Ponticaulis sp. TaxID=2020902 RepID=UPI000C56E82A|nr:2-hydroxychromene-2-carboxylate isomerase [Ponticaulis sp.]MAF58969.1 disulfide bond formation protein DsbA [Ponticaulis sp.]MBN04970.1 disulfide bond formation protein DsbA [Ponticaulis sp.]
MTKTVDFIFDFGSPNAYLAYKVLPASLERTGAKMKIIPSLLGGIFKATNNQSPMMAFGGVKGKLEYENLETRRFIKKHGLTAFKMNPHFPVNTLILMRGAIYAEREGFLDAYVEAGLKAMWEDGQKMDDPEVFVSVMNDAGLDGAAILAGTQEPDVKAGLIANTEAAVGRGVFGIPTFFVGDEMYFGKNTLSDVEEALG